MLTATMQNRSRAIATRDHEKALKLTEISREMGYGMPEIDTTDGVLIEVIFPSIEIREIVEMRL